MPVQVIDETLSPTWDELLVFGKLLVYGRKEDIKRRPPLVTVEIYDYDKVRAGCTQLVFTFNPRLPSTWIVSDDKAA